jgi:glycosyltransferase involved in cell wall biosynthesis
MKTIYLTITPAHDEEQFIGNLLSSVIAQTCRPSQWLIFDDGSTDGTGDIIDRAARDYPWIKPLHLPIHKQRAPERVSAKAADRVLAVHELHRRRLESAGINPSNIRVVMNSPDPRVFRAVEKVRAPNGEFVVVYHGSLIHRLTAIEAIAIARRTIPGLRLRIAGTGDYPDDAQALVRRLDLYDIVTFHGFLSVQEVARFVASADLGVVPNHVNEATHFMLPVKITRICRYGCTGHCGSFGGGRILFRSDAVRYFKSDDAADLALAIEELYRRPEVGAA